MGRGVILLVAPADDIHALAVKRRLEELGGPRPLLCDFATFPFASTVTWASEGGRLGARLSIAPALPQGISRRAAAELAVGQRMEPLAEFGLEEVAAVWLRRPRRVLVHPRLTAPEIRRFAGETAADSVDALLDCALVHNPPAAEDRAVHKFHQLVMAERCGLTIPRTLGTADPSRAERFIRELHAQGRKVVFKQNLAGIPDGPPTRGFEEADWERLGDVALCPTTYQERIEGGCDLRVAVIGAGVFAAEWRRADGPSPSVDVRLDGEVRMWPARAEADLTDKLRRLTAALGLTFAVYDLKIDAARGPVFLECNPSGQWLDMETEAGNPVSEAVARVLAFGPSAASGTCRQPYSENDLQEVLREAGTAR